MKSYCFIIISLCLFQIPRLQAQSATELLLKYDRPAEYWEEALPLGNGQTGAMVFGGVQQERFQLNDHTLWSGYPEPGNNPEAASLLPVLRKQILDNKFDQAEKTWRKMQGPYSARYLPLGDLWLDFEHDGQKATDYLRTLDIQKAISTTTYTIDQVKYTRTAFVSHPAKALVIHLKANKKGKITFKSRLSSELKATSHVEGQQLLLQGKAPKYVAHRTYFPEQVTYDPNEGLEFEARLAIRNKGGKIQVGSDFLQVIGADEVTLVLTESTNFNGFNRFPKNGDKKASNEAKAKMTNALKNKIGKLTDDHTRDFRQLFDRVSFYLEAPAQKAQLMTDSRLRNFEKDPSDLHLQALFFQYGRYLLISSSRPGSRPANLQGLWNDKVQPPWGSNYTININTEMNYWLAENTNLSECHEPLLSFIEELSINGKETARVNYGIHEGWVAHHNSDLWAKTSPVGHFEADKTYYPQAFCWQMGGAWLSLHLWEHFNYTQDKHFLREKAYPLMKGAAQFMLNWLVEDPKSGFLVTAPSTSPENVYTFEGKKYSIGKATTMDISIVRELFKSIISASKELNVDVEFRNKVEKSMAKLYPFKIGRYGQLQEWAEDLDDPNDSHRHISHLFGLFPGSQISNDDNADLVKAARQTLEHRGDVSTGWSMAWKINWWARMQDGDRAYSILNKSFVFIEPAAKKNVKRRPGGGVYSNLFSGHPPFQIDANFGVSAGIIEMLVQSHEGFIRILPALPTAWKTGNINGIKARGNFELCIQWENGNLKEVEIISHGGKECDIIMPQKAKIIGAEAVVNMEGNRYKFNTRKGGKYRVVNL
ncbi:MULTISPECIES: glycosyl hydrolase family 95 catalytic domain-containing protein [Sphingobacterium]|uniref:glycoside hydrolase family 95 protein n=1 Tax=Sphingobacterium TaxID=28453 RepID=UPI0013D980E2|nr:MULTISPECIES: glycoside hydrolase family 95 protein [unclassified Sphingobacterium]